MKNILKHKLIKNVFVPLIIILLIGYAIPEYYCLPVEGMNNASFNHQSYWYYPWGKSICHKGVDIFAPKGNQVYASTSGIVIYTGNHSRGGNMVLILGPKWHIHHYLHLDTFTIKKFDFIQRGTPIGEVGNTGNAVHRPSHLHYAISTPIPYIWQADKGIQGYKKIWYINPTPYLLHAKNS